MKAFIHHESRERSTTSAEECGQTQWCDSSVRSPIIWLGCLTASCHQLDDSDLVVCCASWCCRSRTLPQGLSQMSHGGNSGHGFRLGTAPRPFRVSFGYSVQYSSVEFTTLVFLLGFVANYCLALGLRIMIATGGRGDPEQAHEAQIRRSHYLFRGK